MSAKTGFLLGLVLSLLSLPVAAQGSIGPLQQFQAGVFATGSVRAGSLAYFFTVTPTYPPQPFLTGLVRSDGTPQGTFSIDPRGSVTLQGQSPIRPAGSLGNLWFFITARHSSLEDRALWRTDGTTAGTFPVTEGLTLELDVTATEPPVTLALPERNLLFFSASPRPGTPDFELWATDGTLEGTHLVKDINPKGSSNPRRMITLGGRLYFLADTPEGLEVWRSDGTPEGTERVHGFPTADSGNLRLAQAGGALFVIQDSETGVEVWRSDGTEAGTDLLLDLPQRLQSFQSAGRNLFLIVRDEDTEMWAINGGTGVAFQVLQAPNQEIQLFAVGDSVIFQLEDDHGREPWWSDGLPEGTRRIDICPGPCGSSAFNISFVGTYGNRAVIWADDGVSGFEPWLTDGTPAGTWRLGDLCPGECDSFPFAAHELNGWLVILSSSVVLSVTDGTPDSAWIVGGIPYDSQVEWVALPNRVVFAKHFSFGGLGLLWSLPVSAPAPMRGAWLESSRVPGFRFKVQIEGQNTLGRQEPACMAKTLCVSGAIPGRSEVFLRISDSKPAVVKLTTSAINVWIVQNATGVLRHYRLEGTELTSSILPGLIDREGFATAPAAFESVLGEARKPRTPQPPGRWIESRMVPGFRVQARLTENGKTRLLTREPCNVAETFCLNGATAGVPDLLVRVTGPKPNGFYWPMMARFTPATYEVWIQQRKTGKVRYYRLSAPPAGSSQLDGLFDRQGFKK